MDIYEKLGVRKVINAAGTFTRFGGALMVPEALRAFGEAARHWVDLDELHQKAGEYLAQRLGVEAAYVTSGASGGILVATAACLAGTDSEGMARLPDVDGPCQIVSPIAHAGLGAYHQCVRAAGGRVVWFGSDTRATAAQLAAAVCESTAAVLFMMLYETRGGLLLAETIDTVRNHPVSRDRRIPILVDAAGEMVPRSNFTRYLDMGADLVILSGGKELQGPQGTGLVIGSTELVAACRANGSPNDTIGRALKVTKEEIAALVAAIDRFLARDERAQWRRWQRQVDLFVSALGNMDHVHVEAFVMDPAIECRPMIPNARVRWDRGKLPKSPEQLRDELLAGDPRILVRFDERGLIFDPHVLKPGQWRLVAERLRAVLELD
jgi:L-seryl-tRNA(Ser) seleniumtransferase